MAKPIMQNPTITGKAAKEFSKLFLHKTTPSAEKLERNRKDIELYRSVSKASK
jgi:hypothetical protein